MATSVCQIKQTISNNKIIFGFYNSKGELFCYGNGHFMTHEGVPLFYEGKPSEMQIKIPVSELAADTEYLHRFYLSLCRQVELEKIIDEVVTSS